MVAALAYAHDRKLSEKEMVRAPYGCLGRCCDNCRHKAAGQGAGRTTDVGSQDADVMTERDLKQREK